MRARTKQKIKATQNDFAVVQGHTINTNADRLRAGKIALVLREDGTISVNRIVKRVARRVRSHMREVCIDAGPSGIPGSFLLDCGIGLGVIIKTPVAKPV